MFIKIHKSYRDVVAVCDSDILGKSFEEGNKLLDVRESFYKGKEIAEKELISLMKDFAQEDATFNIVGKDAVACALKAGIISKEGIKYVSDVPFALGLM